MPLLLLLLLRSFCPLGSHSSFLVLAPCLSFSRRVRTYLRNAVVRARQWRFGLTNSGGAEGEIVSWPGRRITSILDRAIHNTRSRVRGASVTRLRACARSPGLSLAVQCAASRVCAFSQECVVKCPADRPRSRRSPPRDDLVRGARGGEGTSPCGTRTEFGQSGKETSEAVPGISVSDGPGDVSYFRTLAPSTGARSISPHHVSPPSFLPRPLVPEQRAVAQAGIRK